MQSYFENRKEPITARTQSVLNCSMHFHTQLELVYLYAGRTRATADEQEVVLRPGDFFLAFPNQLHSFRDLEPVNAMICIFSQQLCTEYRRILDRCVPLHPTVSDGGEDGQLHTLFEQILRAGAHKQPYSDAVARGYLLVLLGELFRRMEFVPVNRHNTDTVRSILEYCSAHYHNPITLDDVAAALHISKYHISHLFNRKIKMGFNEFLNTLRIEEACEALADGQSEITEIAFSVGFSSIRSFNRVFQQQRGVTPSAYRRLQTRDADARTA